MKRLYEALELGKVGLFESPTGTVSFLAELCLFYLLFCSTVNNFLHCATGLLMKSVGIVCCHAKLSASPFACLGFVSQTRAL
jgi:hypothetical protein